MDQEDQNLLKNIKLKSDPRWDRNAKLTPQAGKYIFTNNYSAGSNWNFMAGVTDRPMKMMEIGSQEGRSSLSLLKKFGKHPDSRMYCLELFPEHKAGMERNFDHNMKVAGVEDKVVKMKGESWRSLRELASDEHYETFDIIYVDGWHGANGVIEDALVCHRLLKVGGYLVFDDYTWGKGMPAYRRPKLAIDSYAAIFKPFIKEVSGSKKTFQKKISNEDENAYLCKITGTLTSL